MIRFVALVIACLLPAGPALCRAAAQSVEAVAAYQRGAYDLAIDTAASGPPSADARAFEARALLAKAMCGAGDPPISLVERALAQADAAVEADPRHAEGRLQRAIALSLLVRPMNLNAARRSGYGEAARALAESVLADDPKNFYAHGFLSVWHIEVVRRGGPIGAVMMRASLKSARAHYASARTLAPGDAGLHWQYARALAALDIRAHRAEITAALLLAAEAPVETDLERVMQARARAFSDVLDDENDRAATKFALATL
jgi:hypothetical protein